MNTPFFDDELTCSAGEPEKADVNHKTLVELNQREAVFLWTLAQFGSCTLAMDLDMASRALVLAMKQSQAWGIKETNKMFDLTLDKLHAASNCPRYIAELEKKKQKDG